ncbi:hypothetical protein, partial [Enterobacter cloacae]|uniref:hypothetical protein n=1 Tax=Enterobacter cloacae TaxID=550 RepID=UPI001E3D5CD6
FKNHEYPALYSTFDSNVEFDDVVAYVRANANAQLRLMQQLITYALRHALVDYAHAPTLKLLRAMGLFFYFFIA